MYGKLKEFLTNELEASKPLVYTRTSVSLLRRREPTSK